MAKKPVLAMATKFSYNHVGGYQETIRSTKMSRRHSRNSKTTKINNMRKTQKQINGFIRDLNKYQNERKQNK
jgi:hypothetical protein